MTAQRFPPATKTALRPACEQDFETLYTIDQACYAPKVAYSREELRWYLSLRGAECIVAELPKRTKASHSRPKIVGFIVSVSGRIHGHIVTLDVLEIHRRNGVGSALLRLAESKMSRQGIQDVWLETATNNETAIAFWKKHGYRSRGVLPNYYPNRLDAYAMSKLLVDSADAANEGEERR